GSGEKKKVLRRNMPIGVAARHIVSVAETMGRRRKGHMDQKAHSGLKHVVWKSNWGGELLPDSSVDGTWSFRGVPTPVLDCGEVDTVEHTIYNCVLTSDNTVRLMLRSKEAWTAVVRFASTVLKTKDREDALRTRGSWDQTRDLY
ncbi:hypothetical protein HHI36_011944, partial [Cryptolaemus montrouzieri]